MAKHFEDDGDDFETIIDADGRRHRVLKDGHRARTPMYLMDAQQRQVAYNKKRALADAEIRRHKHVVDAQGSLRLNKPGFRYLQSVTTAQHELYDAALEEVAIARQEYLDAQSSAYRTPAPASSPTGFGSCGHNRGAQVGDACTIDGWAGTMQIDETGELVCVPRRASGQVDGRSLNQLMKDHATTMDAIYLEYQQRTSEMWKSK